MNDKTLKIAMLIAAFVDEQARLYGAVEKVARSAVLLQHEVRNTVRGALEAALKDLNLHVDRAAKTLVDLQKLSLWRAAWQHAIGGRGRHRCHTPGLVVVRAVAG